MNEVKLSEMTDEMKQKFWYQLTVRSDKEIISRLASGFRQYGESDKAVICEADGKYALFTTGKYIPKHLEAKGVIKQ